MVGKLIGKKHVKYVIWMLFLSLCGAAISYQIIITSMLQFLAVSFGILSKHDAYNIDTTIAIAAFIALGILLPLATNNKMGGFRYISILSIISIIYIMIVLLVELPSYFEYNYSYDKLKF